MKCVNFQLKTHLSLILDRRLNLMIDELNERSPVKVEHLFEKFLEAFFWCWFFRKRPGFFVDASHNGICNRLNSPHPVEEYREMNFFKVKLRSVSLGPLFFGCLL